MSNEDLEEGEIKQEEDSLQTYESNSPKKEVTTICSDLEPSI